MVSTRREGYQRARLGARRIMPPAVALATALGLITSQTAAGLSAERPHGPVAGSAATPATPIKHVVVIFQENVSFDHYFGTYQLRQGACGPQALPRPHDRPADQRLTRATFIRRTGGGHEPREPLVREGKTATHSGGGPSGAATESGKADESLSGP